MDRITFKTAKALSRARARIEWDEPRVGVDRGAITGFRSAHDGYPEFEVRMDGGGYSVVHCTDATLI